MTPYICIVLVLVILIVLGLLLISLPVALLCRKWKASALLLAAFLVIAGIASGIIWIITYVEGKTRYLTIRPEGTMIQIETSKEPDFEAVFPNATDETLVRLTENPSRRLSSSGFCSLDLSGSQITNQGLRCLRKRPFSVGSILLDNTTIGDEGLLWLRDNKNLVKLSLCGTKVTDQGMRHLQKMPSLRILSLSDTAVGDKGVQCLRNNKNITSLFLSGTKITDAGMAALGDGADLCRLNVSGTNIGDQGIAGFCKHSVKCSTLTLDSTQITDASLETLSQANNVNWLSVAHTKITDAGMKSLASCKQLSYLNIRGTQVTKQGIAQLKKALPELYIEHDQ